MITEEEVEKCLDFKRDTAIPIAQALHDRVQIENFKKSKLSLLFFEAPSHFKIGEKEQWAYAHKDYQEVVKGLAAAVQEHERLRQLISAADAKIEVWRTIQANHRAGVV